MLFPPVRLSVALGLLLLATLRAWAADSDRSAGLHSGLDVTLDATAASADSVRADRSLHLLALGHVDWSQPAKNDGASCNAYFSVMNLSGRGPSPEFTGPYLSASNTQGYDSTRLYAVWFEIHRDGWHLRAGNLLADEEFARTDNGGNYLNSVFGWPVFVSANTINTGPAFFAAATGLRLRRELGASASWQAGVYDGDTFDSRAGDPTVNRDGLHLRLGGRQGWFLMSEIAFAATTTRPTFKFGGWLHTGNFDDVYADNRGVSFAVSGAAPRVHAGTYGIYALTEQTLRGKTGEAGSIVAHLRIGTGPSDRSVFGWALDTGVSLTGYMPGRPADVLALGFAHADFTRGYARHVLETDPTAPPLDYQQICEVAYTCVVSDRMNVQPDLQLMRHCVGPGRHDSFLFQLRLNARL